MRILFALPLAAFMSSCFAIGAGGDIALPAPRKSGGKPLFEAIDSRGSELQNRFPGGRLEWSDLSTILWAASGHNRDGSKWTVPVGMGRPPYCRIYLALDEGVFRYDWEQHALIQVSGENVKARIPMQDFAKNAPATLYVVADGDQLAAIPNPAWQSEFAAVLAGAMSQNIYLASDSVGVGTRLIYSINREEASKLLKLAANDTALFAMPLGKR